MKTITGMVGVVVLLVGACDKKEADTGAGGEPANAPSIQDKVEKQVAKVAPAAVGQHDASLFGVESAKIVFEVTGMEEGTQTAWIADHGKTVVMVNEMTKPMAKHQTIIWRDGKTTMWDKGEKPYTTGFRSKLTELRLVSTLDPAQLKMAGYAQKPNETIAGQDCEVWHQEKMNVSLWRWKGIDLKYINGVAKGNPPTVIAVEVVSPATIPSELLTPPAK